jgi:hypothetical protein
MKKLPRLFPTGKQYFMTQEDALGLRNGAAWVGALGYAIRWRRGTRFLLQKFYFRHCRCCRVLFQFENDSFSGLIRFGLHSQEFLLARARKASE